jgi:hypothetical protein
MKSIQKIYYEEEYEHLDWELNSVNNTKTFGIYEVNIVFKRRALFYFIVLILPCVILNVLSLTVFSLPVNDTGHMEFTLTLILTYFVLITIVVDSSPPRGEQLPLLGMYIMLCTGVMALSFGMSLILVEIHEHGREKGKKMPRCVSNTVAKVYDLRKQFIKYKAKRLHLGDRSVNNNESMPLKKSPDDDEDITEYELERFKWKLLGKLLNYVFFIVVLIAHIVMPIVFKLL